MKAKSFPQGIGLRKTLKCKEKARRGQEKGGVSEHRVAPPAGGRLAVQIRNTLLLPAFSGTPQN